MRFGQLILVIVFILTPFVGLTQGGVSENERKIFCNFLDSMNHPAFSFTHSEFVRIAELAKRMNHSKLSSKINHFSTSIWVEDAEIFGFEYESKIDNDSIRKGNYDFNLFERNDSMIDFYFQYPPDKNSKTVGSDILEIYVTLINNGNNFYQLQKYGNEAFKAGMQMAENYMEILNEFFVSEPGLYDSKKVDHFVFYNSEEYDGQYWIELYIDKKSKKIKSFCALKYWK